jgi:ElaB/YqjD/DUF883 family membrane-anchored ribosome-binding protein
MIQMLDPLKAMGEATKASLVGFNQVAIRGIERLTEQELAFARDCAAIAISHLKVLSEANSIPDVFKDEVRLATEYGEVLKANAQKAFDISLQAQDELRQWVNESLDRVRTNAEKSAEQVQQASPKVGVYKTA